MLKKVSSMVTSSVEKPDILAVKSHLCLGKYYANSIDICSLSLTQSLSPLSCFSRLLRSQTTSLPSPAVVESLSALFLSPAMILMVLQAERI